MFSANGRPRVDAQWPTIDTQLERVLLPLLGISHYSSHALDILSPGVNLGCDPAKLVTKLFGTQDRLHADRSRRSTVPVTAVTRMPVSCRVQSCVFPSSKTCLKPSRMVEATRNNLTKIGWLCEPSKTLPLSAHRRLFNVDQQCNADVPVLCTHPRFVIQQFVGTSGDKATGPRCVDQRHLLALLFVTSTTI